MRVLASASRRAQDGGDLARAEALLAEWRSLAEEAGGESELLMVANSEASLAVERGDLDTARAQFRAIGERARALGDRGMTAFAAHNLSMVALDAKDFRAAIEHGLEAAELHREVGDDHGTAGALANCGWGALGLSDEARAERFFRDACAEFGRLGNMRYFAACAVALGAALVGQHESEPGARLLGATASLHEQHGIGFLDEDEQVRHEEAVASAKAALGEHAFAEAWAGGEAMTLEEIVAFTRPAPEGKNVGAVTHEPE